MSISPVKFPELKFSVDQRSGTTPSSSSGEGLAKTILSQTQPTTGPLKRKITVTESTEPKKLRALQVLPALTNLQDYLGLNWDKGIPEPPMNDPLPKRWKDFTLKKKSYL